MELIRNQISREVTFTSPTLGSLSFEEMFSKLVDYIEEEREESYNLIIGTDSIEHNTHTIFVSAIVVHRVGHGGRYFYKKNRHRRINSLRQRMFYEASMSLEVAGLLRTELSKNGFSKLHLEIHLDVGSNGDTKDIIREVVGMVRGSGYEAITKPDAYGATKVADRHSK
jgi:predicted RNase H-related nuclease YkuK (DUF458 family)